MWEVLFLILTVTSKHTQVLWEEQSLTRRLHLTIKTPKPGKLGELGMIWASLKPPPQEFLLKCSFPAARRLDSLFLTQCSRGRSCLESSGQEDILLEFLLPFPYIKKGSITEPHIPGDFPALLLQSLASSSFFAQFPPCSCIVRSNSPTSWHQSCLPQRWISPQLWRQKLWAW